MEIESIVQRSPISIVEALPKFTSTARSYPTNLLESKDHLNLAIHLLAEDLHDYFTTITWRQWVKSAASVLAKQGYTEDKCHEDEAKHDHRTVIVPRVELTYYSYQPDQDILFGLKTVSNHEIAKAEPGNVERRAMAIQETQMVENIKLPDQTTIGQLHDKKKPGASTSTRGVISVPDYHWQSYLNEGKVQGMAAAGLAIRDIGVVRESRELHLEWKGYNGDNLKGMYEKFHRNKKDGEYIRQVDIGGFTGFLYSKKKDAEIPKGLIEMLTNGTMSFPKSFSVIVTPDRGKKATIGLIFIPDKPDESANQK